MPRKKRKIFKGTDLQAFNVAGKKGKTPQQRSAIYYAEKRKNRKKKRIKSLIPTRRKGFAYNTKMCKLSKKYKPKDNLLDLIRKNRSPKIISNASNSFSLFIVKSFGKKLNSRDKDLVRSVMSLVISETLSKAFEKPLNVIENIKMFVKMGGIVYKIILKLNEYNKFILNEKDIEIVEENNSEYKGFLLQYPKLKHEINLFSQEENVTKCPICNSELIKKTEGTKVFYLCSNSTSGACDYTLTLCEPFNKKTKI